MDAPAEANDPTGQAPAVSAIVPAHNAQATIERCVEALRGQRLNARFEVIVVDDSSTDDTASLAAAAGATVIAAAGRGAGNARNAGAAAARAPVLAFTDADCFPESDWLAQGLTALEHLDIVQGLVRPDSRARLGLWDRSLWVVSDDGIYQTANLFIRSEVFRRSDGFVDWVTESGGGYRPIGEDVDLVWRARRAGARAGFAQRAIVEHAVFARSPREYIDERRRLAHFPALARRVPELRGRAFFLRFFLSPRTAAFDLALTTPLLAVLIRHPAALLALAPYLATLAPTVGRNGVGPAVIEARADAVGAAALLRGSLRARSPLL